MVKICQTRLLKLNFEIMPKKHIFRFWPKISAGHGWSLKKFFATFQILGPLGCQGWVVIPQNVKKSQNHCTLVFISTCVRVEVLFTLLLKTFTWSDNCDDQYGMSFTSHFDFLSLLLVSWGLMTPLGTMGSRWSPLRWLPPPTPPPVSWRSFSLYYYTRGEGSRIIYLA
jgi:hypothetical protein